MRRRAGNDSEALRASAVLKIKEGFPLMQASHHASLERHGAGLRHHGACLRLHDACLHPRDR